MTTRWRWVMANLALAAAYFIAARAGMATAIGPSQVTAIWPPSGLALAALMLWGVRAVPGLAVGAFLLNWQGFLMQMLPDAPTAAAGGALLLTASSLGQASLAAWAVRRVPEGLAREPARQTLRFALCVALACLVAPTVGNGFLFWQGVLSADDWAYGWLVWWAGDCAGMLVVAPPLLLWRHPAIRRDPIASLAFPIVCMGLGLSLITSFIVGHLEREARIEQFRAASRGVAMRLQQGIDLAQRDLETLRALYYKTDIDAPEFRTVAAPMRQRSPWERSFAWLPRLDEAGAGQYPVHWTEPAAESTARVTHDELADPVLGPAVRRAHDEGVMAATVPFTDTASPDLAVRLYVPVLADGVQGMGLHDPSRMRGLVSVTLSLPALLQGQNDQQALSGLRLQWLDAQAQGLVGLAWEGQQVMPLPAAAVGRAQGVHEQLAVQVGDRTWRLLARPADAAASLRPSWLQVGVFCSGLAFTLLLSGFMVLRRRRDLDEQLTRQRLEADVGARTHDLSQANQQLQREIDERRQLEDALRDATAQAESANRAKSMFLANMSHEIRTPLNAVIGYAQLLREDTRLASDTRERVAAIHGAGRRLLRLINDVLDLSKIESGGMTLQPERFEVWRELDDVVRLFAPRIEAKGLSLQVGLDLPQPSWVLGDRNKIGQIVINLLGNALKFTEQGQISLRAGRQGERLWLEVEDTGPGLAADELARLFTPFQQGAAGRDKGGTGLGLALSRHMARAMGGDLTMSSVPGQGTVARVWLPLALEAAPLTDAAQPESTGRVLGLDPATPCRVLVVEDDTDSRVILVQALAGLGCQVSEAGDGETAWQRLNEQPFDIVFTDIRMPVLDGLALLQRLRAQARFAALPVVAVSASSLEHERRFYVQQGFHDFVGKPYEFAEIRQMLARHARVRWRYEAAAAGASPAAADLAGHWAPTTVADLTELAELARSGDMQAVRASMNKLSADVLGSTAWRRLDAAARQYDFAALAEQADDIAQHGPQGEAV